MAVNVKMGVDLSGFRSGIQQGTQILKGLNSEMKAAEAEFKATGNAEQLMTSKTKTLNSQIQVQKGIVDQAKTALQQMTDAGVDPADKAYQSMYATMMKAQAGMYEAQAALNGLNTSAQEAATGADKLTNSVNSIGKKISLDQVISGIGSITGALESAASKAVQLGEELWNVIMDRAKWADDTATMAAMYGIDIDKFQRMQKLVTNGMDTTVDSVLTAQSKMKKGIGDQSIIDELEKIGVSVKTAFGDEGVGDYVMKDSIDLFWEAGKAIMNLGDEYEKEATAQKVFGKGWKELSDLFDKYGSREEYEEALKNVNVNSEETIENLVDLNDTVGELKGNFDTLTTEILGQLAPALTEVAGSLSNLLSEIIAYLQTPEGKEMLQGLADSVSSLFEDLGKIDPETAVQSFTTVFNGLVDGLKWIVENKETLKGALIAVVGAWGAMKIGGSVLTLIKLIDGLKSLGLLGGGSGAASGAASGAGSAAAGGAGSGAGWFSSLGAKISGAGSTASILGFVGAEAALAYAGWKMIEANLNDPELNKIYGTTWGSGNDTLIDTMSEEAAQAAKEYWDVYQDTGSEAAMDARDKLFKILEGEGYQNTEAGVSFIEDIFNSLLNENDIDGNGQKLLKVFESIGGEDGIPIRVDPQPPGDTPEKIKEEVGVVSLDAQLVVTGITAGGKMGLTVGGMPSGGGGGGLVRTMLGYANGLPYVPSDGLYRLHRGERVTPAREAGRSFSSNLYVENMNMSGGLSADALAASIAARNQRMMSGYGS